jgi:hypothetical protein
LRHYLMCDSFVSIQRAQRKFFASFEPLNWNNYTSPRNRLMGFLLRSTIENR